MHDNSRQLLLTNISREDLPNQSKSVASLKSPVRSESDGTTEFAQLIPLQFPQATEYDSPCFLQLHCMESQSVLQLHRTLWSRVSGAGGRSVWLGYKQSWRRYHSQSSGFISKSTLSHCCTCKYTHIEWYFTAAEVGGSVWTWTKVALIDTFSQNRL